LSVISVATLCPGSAPRETPCLPSARPFILTSASHDPNVSEESTMRSTAKTPSLTRWFGPALAVLGLALLAGVRPGSAADEAPKPPAAQVKALQEQYKKDRDAAAKAGLAKTFAPEWFDQADALAKQGAAALEAGRLIAARDLFRRARRGLPSLPAQLPKHVARIFGDNRLRHGGPVTAVSLTKSRPRPPPPPPHPPPHPPAP